jgi:hypothetical protein
LLVALACARRDGADGNAGRIQAEVVSAQPVKTPNPAAAVAIATRWLAALRDGDPRELEAHTRYPFEIHDEGGNCRDQTAANPERLSDVLACLSKDAALIDLLRTHDSAAVEPLADTHLADWAKKWRVTTMAHQQIVVGFFHRDDARAHFDLWVSEGGVRGVWKSGVNGSAAVMIATEWIQALGNRDLEQLARVTGYPFEVRDIGRDAQCGKRVAKDRDALGVAVECLFRSERLHQALLNSPASRLLADEPPKSLPDWSRPWWRQSEHAGLQNLFTVVATAEGDAFDFQILVSRDGVRALWKLGSFESRN